MLIKSIKMENFRQYENSELIFSTDPEKNITLVMGDNGTGKTTLAQAFLWCLYGQTDFEIKEVLNRKVRDTLPSQGGKATACVELVVNYKDIDYTISRTQEFTKAVSKVSSGNDVLRITYKDKGNLKSINETERYLLIKEMLPKELSRFFFFDGERIRAMSDDINHGRSKDFKEAVTGLVGLNSIHNAIMHLEKVCEFYKSKIDESGDQEVQALNRKANENNDKILSIQARLDELTPLIADYVDENNELKNMIMQATPEILLKNKYNELIEKKQKREARRNKIIKDIFSSFSKNLYDFAAKEIILQAMPEINAIKESTQNIPKGIDRPALMNLLERGTCVCGEPLKMGDFHYQTIINLLDLVPPVTTGTRVQELKNRCRGIEKNGSGYFEHIKELVKEYKEIKEDIDDITTELNDTFVRLSDTSEGEKAKEKLNRNEIDLEKLRTEKTQKEDMKKIFLDEIDRIENRKATLINITKKNEAAIRYLAYAEELYFSFFKRYNELEASTRDILEEKINDIFPKIYEGGLKIEIDPKYNIKVLVDDEELEDDEIEKNTAQSYSVIFAFITSIIAMAKDKSLADSETTEEEKTIFEEAEGYPLVMDAPLSNFDKTRIEQICTTIPQIAKQVVFFIKDTDGEIAEEHMKNKIGEKYVINAESKTLSTLEHKEEF